MSPTMNDPMPMASSCSVTAEGESGAASSPVHRVQVIVGPTVVPNGPGVDPLVTQISAQHRSWA
jgi:hypothetical protein